MSRRLALLFSLPLLTLAACYVAALAWMHSLTRTPPAPRLLTGPHPGLGGAS